ncbi:hypothetical protein AVEN_248073-1, partial [Araneus ventricosus]
MVKLIQIGSSSRSNCEFASARKEEFPFFYSAELDPLEGQMPYV